VTERINRQWRLAARPEGAIKESDFAWHEEPLRPLQAGEALVRNLYLSIDPTNRIWMTDMPGYLPPVQIGEVMRGIAVGVVEESLNDALPAGAHVTGLLGWQDYAITDGAGLRPMPQGLPIPPSFFLGLFGHIGLTAYFGLLEVGRPQAGETLVVSAAAGATGSLVGQIGKIKGCRVVGIAGGAEKCRRLTDELGFDAAVDYKAGAVLDQLKEHCPAGVDVYFENVGGALLDDVLSLINLRARVVLCGLISQYNADAPVPGPYNFGRILVQRARVEGFIVLDYAPRAAEAFADLSRWYAEGRLKYREEVVAGLERAPATLTRLFTGAHDGKLVVKI
jgi:NADPH-dependent curcumin reductase CurA